MDDADRLAMMHAPINTGRNFLELAIDDLSLGQDGPIRERVRGVEMAIERLKHAIAVLEIARGA